MKDICVVTTYHSAPRNHGAMTAAVDDLVNAIRSEEFGTGGMGFFSFYRRQGIVGTWYCVVQFRGDGWNRHGRGEKVRAAQQKLDALLCEPAHRQFYDPVIVWGAGEQIEGAAARPDDTNPAHDVGVLFDFIVDTKDDSHAEAIMREIFGKVAKYEVPTGNVRTYALYRDIAVPGRWFMFEHFTAKGSALHAANPDVMASGSKSAALMTGPYGRTMMVPANVNGCGEPLT